ncbi:hypothetical protein C5167_040176 [Papaver somniferum]|uniref:Uncharacterized protein n=1 Tax=Papaver somniferum TaxID=3469 RepID=A0A4Y7IEE2_PAPSO|nr:hypothetical protein C5167_040176 [Papaver somniferum]
MRPWIPAYKLLQQIWDTAGQERFKVVTSAYCSGAGRALIVHDITRTTFDSVSRWLGELNIHSDTTIARIDLGNIRDVSVEEGKSLAEAEGLFFMETSALDSTKCPNCIRNGYQSNLQQSKSESFEF